LLRGDDDSGGQVGEGRPDYAVPAGRQRCSSGARRGFHYGDAMTDGQIPNQLDNETIARLRDGGATAADEIAKREAWLAVAKDYGDNSRVAVLEAQLEQLRRG